MLVTRSAAKCTAGVRYIRVQGISMEGGHDREKKHHKGTFKSDLQLEMSSTCSSVAVCARWPRPLSVMWWQPSRLRCFRLDSLQMCSRTAVSFTATLHKEVSLHFRHGLQAQ